MAHPAETKALALALLILGERVNHVARRVSIPRQTVSRWNAEKDEIIDRCIQYDLRLTLGELGKKMGLNGT